MSGLWSVWLTALSKSRLSTEWNCVDQFPLDRPMRSPGGGGGALSNQSCSLPSSLPQVTNYTLQAELFLTSLSLAQSHRLYTLQVELFFTSPCLPQVTDYTPDAEVVVTSPSVPQFTDYIQRNGTKILATQPLEAMYIKIIAIDLRL